MDKQQEMLSGVLSMCYGDISGVQQKEAPFLKKTSWSNVQIQSQNTVNCYKTNYRMSNQ